MAALSAQAGPTARIGKPDPLDPKATVPALIYESSFRPDGRSVADRPISWREANDTVTRIGGWRSYAREAQQPDPAPAPKPSSGMPSATPTEPGKPMPMPPALPQGHGGTKMP